jgi:hypothetical protein
VSIGASTKGEPARLGIDITMSGIAAVIDTNRGEARPLLFNGAPHLAATVVLDPDDRLLVGAEALVAGINWPDRTVPDPLGLSADPIDVAGVAVDPVQVAAALFARVVSVACDVAGSAGLAEVIVGVPSTWGPARRNRLRRAASMAGLGQIRMVDSAVALAVQRSTGSTGSVLVARVDGVHAESTVLRPYGDSAETIAALDNDGHPDADPVAMAVEAAIVADLPSGDTPAIYCLSADPNHLAPFAARLQHAFGVNVTPLVGGGLAAAQAILDAYRPSAATIPRRASLDLIQAALRVVIPAAAAVILLVQGIDGTNVYGDSLHDPLVITEWAAFIVAGLCTVLAGAATAQLLNAYLHRKVGQPTGELARQLGAVSITTALTVAYALIAASDTNAPVTAFLAWTTIPALIVAVTVVVHALATRTVGQPTRTFPLLVTCLGSIGVICIAAANINVPGTSPQIWPLLLRGGAAMVGVAVAVLLTTRRRWLLAPPVAAIFALVAGLNTSRTIAIIFTAAVGAWWAGTAIRAAVGHPAPNASPRPSSTRASSDPESVVDSGNGDTLPRRDDSDATHT